MKKEEYKYIILLVFATLILLSPSGVYLERPSDAYIDPSTVPQPCLGASFLAIAPATGASPSSAAWDRLEDILDSVPRLSVGGGHGTAVTIAWDGNFTYLLTARHVVDEWDPEEHNCLQGIHRGVLYHLPVQLYAMDGEADLAVVVTPYKIETLKLGSEPKLRDTVIAAGYPRDTFPAVFSLGVVRNPLFQRWLYHSAGIWFGNSGGPLLDYDTLSVIGINVVIFNVDIPDRPSNNHAGAVPLADIRKFLELHGLD